MDTTGRDPENDLTGLEQQLARFRPAPIALERDKMLFEAGRASALAERRGRLGMSMAAIFALIAVGFGGLFVRERARLLALEVRLKTDTREVVRQTPSTSPIPDRPYRPIEPDSYLSLTRQFLSVGLDAAPQKVRQEPRESIPARPSQSTPPLRVRGSDGLSDI
jgi:hypothetical protein